MLFILNNGRMFAIEYKLYGERALEKQVEENHPHTFGILNCKLKKTSDDYRKIFSYTGLKDELKSIKDFIDGKWYYEGDDGKVLASGVYPFGRDRFDKNKIFTVYWWGYKNTPSSLIGGFRSGKRLSFCDLYKQAIVNLQEEYQWKLDLYLVYNVLGFYSKNTCRIFYTEVMNKQK